ncbi:unnamed protein product [Rhizoctonia solani]|uniref:SWI/SNF and RSC complexes subunit Ssr4 N-terminal domain-containing protein n=1 Tax=Rhizoctonia solani TaxID=456999 RepID=A0A8H3C993_9AGAM|nr:unnamed protein product [Rhizoctonia solani]
MNARPPDSVLRCTHHFGTKPSLSFEEAIQFLHQLCQGAGANLTYSWQFIDRPADGDIYVYFQVSAPTPLIDGVQYLDNESTYRPSQDLEVHEVRFGFIPGVGEKEAGRVRKRYRLLHGGHPSIVLVHYTKGPAKPVPPAMNVPIRNYPLPIINEAPMYVIGEKSGQRAMIPNAAQMVSQQQQQLDALAASRRQAANLQPQVRRPDDDSDEESNRVSTRALAVTRFKRNHELLAEIFAVNAVASVKGVPSPYEKADKARLEAKLASGYAMLLEWY